VRNSVRNGQFKQSSWRDMSGIEVSGEGVSLQVAPALAVTISLRMLPWESHGADGLAVSADAFDQRKV
jgi:hypothetical protein